MQIRYEFNRSLTTEEIIAVFDGSGIERPTADPQRIRKMFDHANLILSAWDGEELIGLARSLTDHAFCCYMSDLAVKKAYQHQGIGKELIRLTKEKIGDQVMLLLLAAQPAMGYYPKIGMENINSAFILRRTR